jgi:hypothetical protein
LISFSEQWAASAHKLGEIEALPKAATGTLNPDVGAFKDLTGRRYGGGFTPEDIVVDHRMPRAAGGHPTDLLNLEAISRESNAIKSGREGPLLRYEAYLRSMGMSEQQIMHVTASEWVSIMNDVHAAPVDPSVLRRF